MPDAFPVNDDRLSRRKHDRDTVEHRFDIAPHHAVPLVQVLDVLLDRVVARGRRANSVSMTTGEATTDVIANDRISTIFDRSAIACHG